MILEWSDDDSLWYEECFDITFELDKIWVYTLDKVYRLRNDGTRFYYNNEGYNLSASLSVNKDGHSWITWGEVEDGA